MKTSQTITAKLSVSLFGVHPSGCCSPSNTLKRGHGTAALLFSVAALTIGSLLLLSPASSRAQGGVPLWTNRYNGPGNRSDTAAAIAVDSSGNVFVTGSSYNADTNLDYATIKYSNAGVPLWTNRYDGPGNGSDQAWAIAVDSTGNVFVTGQSSGIGRGWDYATVKYSSSGVPLWTNRYDSPGDSGDWAAAIAVDNSGNVFVTGTSRGDLSDLQSQDYLTIKYSNAGDLLWINRYDGANGFDQVAVGGIALDSRGNVFVTGGSQNDYATIAYSNSGETLWVNRYDYSSSGDFALAIAVDSNGNVFVTGSSYKVPTLDDYATVAYSNAGVPMWTGRYNGSGNPPTDYVIAIALDDSGNVFVTGSSFAANGLSDFVTIKYSKTGVPLWTRRYNGPGNGNDDPTGIAVDSDGNVFITGNSESGSATIAYSNNGVPIWTNRFNGGYGKMAVDRSGNVFVLGSSWNGTNYDYVTIKYSSSVPPPRLAFQKLNNALVLNWTNAGFHLQTAPAVTALFTNLPAATSPFTNPLTAPQRFFRLIRN